LYGTARGAEGGGTYFLLERRLLFHTVDLVFRILKALQNISMEIGITRTHCAYPVGQQKPWHHGVHCLVRPTTAFIWAAQLHFNIPRTLAPCEEARHFTRCNCAALVML
jgi:hypothetical protein